MTAQYQASQYPASRRDDLVEDLHGHKIADPYRWLEDPDSAETVDWVRRQNEVTEAHLRSLPARDWFQRTMRAILERPRAGVPEQKAGWFFVSRNDGKQPQDVLYVADSLEGLLEGGRVIIDPNKFSQDGTDSLGSFTVSGDGRYLTYGINESGSDWTTFHLVEVATEAALDDRVTEAKFCEAVWLPDSASYLYVHFPASGRSEGTETKALSGGRLNLHRIGTPQAEDELILHFPENDRLVVSVELSHDDKYVVAHIVEGTEYHSRLWLYPVSTADGRSELGEPHRLIDEPLHDTRFVRTAGDRLVLSTDQDAPRGRLVTSDLDGTFTELVAEGAGTLLAASAAGDGLVTVSLVDAQPLVELHTLDGAGRRRIALHGGGVVDLNAETGHDEIFIGLSSATEPTASYVISAASGEVRALPELAPTGSADFTAPDIRVTRRTEPNRDVSYFLISRTDLSYDEPRPTLLYGYGGFKIPVLADYTPGWPAWLAAGGVLVIANLRGGGEYGSDWHDAGRLKDKQNVFDDFIAVAEHLHETEVTTPQQLAIHGRSNGGLLVGAAMTQRPDLFAAAVPGVGVMDMLRFHLFTVGAAWASDYGLPDDPEQFEDLLAYSPLHNLREGTAYPATLVLTGDHDDRVVPLHSHKFIATLQHVQAGERPALARIEVDTGHGFGKPLALIASEWADLLAFAAHHTGLKPA
jgi:prolyl oligopeptidase